MENCAVAEAMERLEEFLLTDPTRDVQELVQLRDAVDCLVAQVTRVIVDGDAYVPHCSPVSFLRHETTLSTGAAIAACAAADQYEYLPLSLEAMERGEIGFSHFALMAQARETIGESFDERKLLSRAAWSTVTEFRRCVQQAVHAARREDFLRQEQNGRESRQLKLSTDETGALWLRGWLEPEGASIVRSALEELAGKAPAEAGVEDARSRSQRLGDALVDLASQGVETELIVTVPLETLVAVSGAPAAEAEWGGLLSSELVARLACDSPVRRLVLDGAGNIVDFGRRRRLFSPAARKAMVARDGHCGFPHCDMPARWCEGHHRTAFSEGGRTDVNDGILLCRRHHHLVHERGWRLAFDPDTGRPRAIPPPADWWNWPAAPHGPDAESPKTG